MVTRDIWIPVMQIRVFYLTTTIQQLQYILDSIEKDFLKNI